MLKFRPLRGYRPRRGLDVFAEQRERERFGKSGTGVRYCHRGANVQHITRHPRLVLGCVNADFRVQTRIFQRFSRSTRKSSSRKQILQNFTNFVAKFLRILQNFEDFLKFAKFCNFSQFFSRILQNFVDFEKINVEKNYIGCKILIKFG